MKKILLLIVFIQNICFPQSGWIEQVSGTTQNLTSIFFTDINNGFIIGNAGTLLKTTDGGTTWNPQSLGTTANLKTISFLTHKMVTFLDQEKLFIKQQMAEIVGKT